MANALRGACKNSPSSRLPRSVGVGPHGVAMWSLRTAPSAVERDQPSRRFDLTFVPRIEKQQVFGERNDLKRVLARAGCE